MNEMLKPFYEALNMGKTLEISYSEECNIYIGWINGYDYRINFISEKEIFSIEVKYSKDGGYPYFEYSLDEFEMSETEFLQWFDKFSDKSDKIKIK